MNSKEVSLDNNKSPETTTTDQLNCDDTPMDGESSTKMQSEKVIDNNAPQDDKQVKNLMECEDTADDKDNNVHDDNHSENNCDNFPVTTTSTCSTNSTELHDDDHHPDVQRTLSNATTIVLESSDDGDGPSCSYTRFFKNKKNVAKRHFRKKSDEYEDADVESRKKARDSRSSDNEENDSPSGLSINTPTSAMMGSDGSGSPRYAFTSLSPQCNPVADPEEDKDSDDDRSTNEKADDSNEWTTVSEDEEDKIPSVLLKQKPKPRWFVVPDLMNRQIGNNQFIDRKFYGSLHVVQRLELMQKLEAHEGCVNALDFNEAGNLLASGADDTKVVVWNWAIGKAQEIFVTGHTLNIFEVKWLPIDYESLIMTCSRDGHVRLLDVRTNTHRGLATHRQEARRLAVHGEHPYGALSVGDDGKVLSIDIRAPKPTKLLTVREGRSNVSLYTININPRNSNEFCVGGRSKSVKIYDRRRNHEPIQQRSPQNLSHDTKAAYVTSAVYNYNGTEIVASYNDDDIYLFDMVLPHPNGDYAHKYEGHRNQATMKSVNFFGPKSEFIVSGSDCGNIFFWDKNTEAIVQWMAGDEEGVVNRLEPHPHVPILATSGLDHDVKIWIPSCEVPPSMTELERCVKSNQQNRADEVTSEPDEYDSQVLMFFLRSIRQYGSRANNQRSRMHSRNYLYDAGGSDTSSDSGSGNSDSQSDDMHEGPQCSPS